jgi:hypothetical protein
MKELKAIIRSYVSDKSEIRAQSIADWFKTEHQMLWEDVRDEYADKGLLTEIKLICNEHAVRTRAVNHSGKELKLRLRYEKKVVEQIPNLPRFIHVIDPETGSAIYYPWQEATDPMLAEHQALSTKQSEDCAQTAMALGGLRRLRNDMGIPPLMTFSQHMDALRQ